MHCCWLRVFYSCCYLNTNNTSIDRGIAWGERAVIRGLFITYVMYRSAPHARYLLFSALGGRRDSHILLRDLKRFFEICMNIVIYPYSKGISGFKGTVLSYIWLLFSHQTTSPGLNKDTKNFFYIFLNIFIAICGRNWLPGDEYTIESNKIGYPKRLTSATV